MYGSNQTKTHSDCFSYQLDQVGATWEQSASMVYPRYVFSLLAIGGKPMLWVEGELLAATMKKSQWKPSHPAKIGSLGMR